MREDLRTGDEGIRRIASHGCNCKRNEEGVKDMLLLAAITPNAPCEKA